MVEYSLFKMQSELLRFGKAVNMDIILEGRELMDKMYLELKQPSQDLKEEFKILLAEPDDTFFNNRFKVLQFGLRTQPSFITDNTKKLFLQIVGRALKKSEKEDKEQFHEKYDEIYKMKLVLAVRGITNKDFLAVYKKLLDDFGSQEGFDLESFAEYGFSWRPLKFCEAFDAVQKTPEILKFVSNEYRKEWLNEINNYFAQNLDEVVSEALVRSIIAGIREMISESKTFSEILEWSENCVKRFRERGAILQDLTLVNYQLGLCKEVQV